MFSFAALPERSRVVFFFFFNDYNKLPTNDFFKLNICLSKSVYERTDFLIFQRQLLFAGSVSSVNSPRELLSAVYTLVNGRQRKPKDDRR